MQSLFSRVIATMIIVLATMSANSVSAQLNKAYFTYKGRAYLSDSQYEQAIRTLNAVIRLDANAYEALFLRGVAKYNLDDLIGAEADFTAAIERNPVYTMAYHHRAFTRMRLGNHDDALRDFQEAIDLRPDLPGPYYSRAVTHMFSQRYEEAIADFNEFIKREGLVVDAYVGRGMSYMHMGDSVRAYEDFDRAVRTNREDPQGYFYRGALLMSQEKNEEALADFNKAIECDSVYAPAYFNRAVLYSNNNRPLDAISDFTTVIAIDSTDSHAYFNRAIIRSQIGDYNNALEDYNQVIKYTPGNVLVYINRANLYGRLGDLNAAAEDYSRAIELYPDFANAYLYRSQIRYLLRDERGSRRDREIAEAKIEEYRSKLNDSTFSIYADTSRKFNQLLAFETRNSSRIPQADQEQDIRLRPLFRFALVAEQIRSSATGYYSHKMNEFMREIDEPHLAVTTSGGDVRADSLLGYDPIRDITEEGSKELFLKAIAQAQIRQYTASIGTYTEAIDRDPTNPFLYLNRSTTRSEMIDFISSIDNTYQRISVDADPSSSLKNNSTRTYNYDEAIGDLNKAAKLMPDFAYIYYNRANLQALSGRLPEAYEDYTRAIELFPGFAEAYFNRGLVQIYLNDTRKGCLDMSKAGELGIADAYGVLKKYAYTED